MTHNASRLTQLVAGSLLLAGCATSVPPVAVTRFHAAQPAALAAGTRYRIDAAPLADSDQAVGAATPSLEWTSYRAAVDRELQRLGFVAASASDSRAAPLLVRIGFERTASESRGGGSPVSVGVGGSTGGYRSGIGLGIGFSLGSGRRNTLDLRLLVRIDDRATGQAQWEGRAETVVPRSAPAAQPALAAAKLAAALFKDFPGESGRTINVP